MKATAGLAQAGMLAFALGLSLAGPQAAGVAAADRGSTESAATSTGQRSAAGSETPSRRAGLPAGVRRTPAVTAMRDNSRGGRAGHHPAAPVGSPLSWAVAAVATRETFSPAGAPVVAIPQTPLVTALRLQEIPVIGPVLVTPIVTIVNSIPVVGDLLHPIFGYPLQPDGCAAPRDVRVVSFDGTQINVHFLPAPGLRAGQSAPTVFLGSSVGMPGGTSLNGTPIDALITDLGGVVGIAALRNAGYNVVTWDPRGAYFSGGLMQMDSPDFEARDVSAIVSWVAELPEAQLDAPGDPRMGMVGASYGGGIQTVVAAADHRVDAIVPALAWNTLTSSIYPNGAFKSGQGALLAAALLFSLTRVDPRFIPVLVRGVLTGTMTPAGQNLLAGLGPGPDRDFPDLVSRIAAPTMLIQGTVDPMFSLMQSDLTARTLLAQDVATKVLWFCGGHGLCVNNLFDFSEGALIERRTVEWLDRYVKGEPVSTGPGFEWVDQRGQRLFSTTYPAPVGEPIVAALSAGDVLPLIPVVGGSVLPVVGTRVLNAVDLRTPVSATTAYIVGAPQLTLRYSGTGWGDHVYAQLVDNTTGLVLGNQVTPIPVTLDGRTHTITVPLQPVAQTLLPGETVTLQLFSWTVDYPANTSLGALTVTDMQVTLPTTPDPRDGWTGPNTVS